MFRAPDLATAGTILASMWGIAPFLDGAATAATVRLDIAAAGLLIAAFGMIVLTMPNTQEILRNYWVSSDPQPSEEPSFLRGLLWRATPNWAAVTAIVFVIAFASIKGNSTFLYYQF